MQSLLVVGLNLFKWLLYWLVQPQLWELSGHFFSAASLLEIQYINGWVASTKRLQTLVSKEQKLWLGTEGKDLV